jgi:hypothetical protein
MPLLEPLRVFKPTIKSRVGGPFMVTIRVAGHAGPSSGGAHRHDRDATIND